MTSRVLDALVTVVVVVVTFSLWKAVMTDLWKVDGMAAYLVGWVAAAVMYLLLKSSQR